VFPQLHRFKHLESVNILPALSGLPSLTKLDLAHNWLRESIPLSPLASTLQVLNLSRNDITQLHPNHFSPKFTSLANLDLRRNSLATLPEGFLSLFPVLDTLDLGDNVIHTLPEDFGSSKSLKKVVLRGNKLKSLPENFYRALGPKVSALFLEANELTALPDFTETNDNLQTLSFSENFLTALPSGLQHVANLGTLRGDHNRLETLPEDLGLLVQLTKIILPYNRLSSLPASIGNLKFLNWCDLGNNGLQELPAEFAQLENLSVLFLKGNLLSSVDALAPVWKLGRLVELDLSSNGISSVSEDISTCTSLATLRLSGNHLTEATFPSLAALPAFSGSDKVYARPSLYLNDNLFTQVPASVLSLQGLQLLTLDGNPIHLLPGGLKDLAALRVLLVSYLGRPSHLDTQLEEIQFPELERLYICPPHHKRPQDDKLILSPYLTDSDIMSSDHVSTLARQAYLIPPGPSTRHRAFSQMLGSMFPCARASPLPSSHIFFFFFCRRIS